MARESSQRCRWPKEPNNTEEAAVGSTTENEMNATEESLVQKAKNIKNAVASTSNRIKENVSTQEEIGEETE